MFICSCLAGSAQLLVDGQLYRAVVGSEDFGVDRLKEFAPMDSAKYPWNDIGAGHIFADFYKDRLRYVPERKMWFYYEDGIWNKDTGSLRAMKYCMELANLMYTFALEITDEDLNWEDLVNILEKN